jgi:hypothetical protein
MPADDSLKRLGGGRWETRDGRFAIEPQSGTWVVVDSSQTDELGLPLVRGPFGSLTAAREAIEVARSAGPAASPLAARLEEAGKQRRTAATSGTTSNASKPTAKAVSSRKSGPAAEPPEPPEPAPEPPEPKWLRDMGPAQRRRARELLERLEQLGVSEREEIVRAEIARDQPALTRLAIERRLREVLESATDTEKAVRAAVKVILAGRDSELDVRWRLVDDRGRHIDDLDPRG